MTAPNPLREVLIGLLDDAIASAKMQHRETVFLRSGDAAAVRAALASQPASGGFSVTVAGNRGGKESALIERMVEAFKASGATSVEVALASPPPAWPQGEAAAVFDRLQNFIAATDPALLDAFWFMEHNTPEAIAARRAALQPPAAPEPVDSDRPEDGTTSFAERREAAPEGER